jgi:NitT/TauT family transport system permease protein
VLWEFVARFVVHDPAFLAPPSIALLRIWEMLLSGTLLIHAGVSGEEFLVGYVLGCGSGILLGAAMAAWRPVDDLLSPWVFALNAAPIVALAPIIILWFGIGVASKVAVVIFLVIFTLSVNTEVGIRSADQHLVTLARSFGATRRQIFFTVSLPWAVPFIVSGLRLAVGRALIGVVVGELFGARAGLGYVITDASQVFDMPTLFAAVIILAGAGIVLTSLLRALERRLAVWRAPAQE